jgi:hypothetical protein
MNSIVSTAALASATAIPSPTFADVGNADPIFAAIEAHRLADDAHQKAIDRYFDAESDFVDEFGASTPDAISKELREAWKTAGGLGKFRKDLSRVWIKTHAEVTKLNRIWPRDLVAGLHRELNRQTEALNRRVEPLRIASDQAGDAADDALHRLTSTRPTTLAGLAAVTAYFRYGTINRLFESVYDDNHMNNFLDMVVETVQSIRQS